MLTDKETIKELGAEAQIKKMKTQDKIKLNVLEKMKMLFPMSKEPIAITSAIELTYEECEEEITKLKVEYIQENIKIAYFVAEAKDEEQTAKVEKLKHYFDNETDYKGKKIKDVFDEIFGGGEGGTIKR